MFACVHVCMDVCAYTQRCVYIYVCIHISGSIMHIYIYTHTHILCFVYVCSHTCVDLLMHAFSICMGHAVYLLIQRSTLLS